MCVGVGSFSDPMEAQGLAHFLGQWRPAMSYQLAILLPLKSESVTILMGSLEEIFKLISRENQVGEKEGG
jgi:hypothetical protein